MRGCGVVDHSKVELLACPFCGRPAAIATKRATRFPGSRKVSCSNDGCGAHFAYWHPDEWNRRAARPAQTEQEPVATEDSARLEFMLERHRTVVVELLPSRGDCGKYAIYVEEGFMRDKRYPSVRFTVTGALRADDEAFKKAKLDAIDAAIAAQGADV